MWPLLNYGAATPRRYRAHTSALGTYSRETGRHKVLGRMNQFPVVAAILVLTGCGADQSSSRQRTELVRPPPVVVDCPTVPADSGLSVRAQRRVDYSSREILGPDDQVIGRALVGPTVGSPTNLRYSGVYGVGEKRLIWFRSTPSEGEAPVWVTFTPIGRFSNSVMVVSFTVDDRSEWERRAGLLSLLIPPVEHVP